MLFEPYQSFEMDIFTVWNSGRRYNLSIEWLKEISTNELLDLLSNNLFNVKWHLLETLSKNELLLILNNLLMKFHSPKYFHLFSILDPREKKLSHWEKKNYSSQYFPEHVLTLLTHWTFYIPVEVNKNIKNDILNSINNYDLQYKDYLRIIKNFSDFWTKFIVNSWGIPKQYVISHKYSRFVGDPARAIESHDFVRDTDWSKNLLYWIQEENKKY
jgi:hypothetical protein